MPPRLKLYLFLGIFLGLIFLGAGLYFSTEYFFYPHEIKAKKTSYCQPCRIGGVVKKGSIKQQNGIYSFILADDKDEIRVEFKGIIPPLFKEDFPAVVVGKIDQEQTIIATQIMSSHGEEYRRRSGEPVK